MSFKKILVPVDGSGHSKKACEEAAELASCLKAAIGLTHCFDALPNLIGGESRAELIAENEKAAARIFEDYIPILKKYGIPYETSAIHGQPGITISNTAAQSKYDLIVMGSRGLGDVESIILGSVSHDVLEYATMPVMLVNR